MPWSATTHQTPLLRWGQNTRHPRRRGWLCKRFITFLQTVKQGPVGCCGGNPPKEWDTTGMGRRNFFLNVHTLKFTPCDVS